MIVPTLRQWLQEQPFHLALSAGFFGFFAHCGVVSVLEEQGLVPASISGSSAGALTGGLWAAGLTAHQMRAALIELRKHHFWDPHPGFGLLRGSLFRSRVEQLLPVAGFQDTRIPFAASVFDLRLMRTIVVRSGALAPAICASCALPGMFHPVWIDGHPCVDGGVADRPAHAALPQETRVLYHHLLSKSPWRSRAPHVPARSDMISLVLPGLPRPGPFHLDRGPNALEAARSHMRALLTAKISSGTGRREACLTPAEKSNGS
jgi:NTE family protein